MEGYLNPSDERANVHIILSKGTNYVELWAHDESHALQIIGMYKQLGYELQRYEK